MRQAGKIEEAIAHYEQALRINPDYAEAHNNLGLLLAQTGRIEEAIAHFEQALRIKPDYAEAHCALGMALEQTGQVREAVGHYEQALRIRTGFDASAECAGAAASSPVSGNPRKFKPQGSQVVQGG